MDFYRHRALNTTARHIHYAFVYALAIIFSYHTLLIAYNTSSFIGAYLTPSAAGVLHGAGALGAVGLLLLFPRLLARFGAVMVGICTMLVACGFLLMLALGQTPFILILALCGFLVVNPLIYLVIDVFSETLIGTSEGNTGSKRGLTLALMSAAAVFAPLSMGYIMGEQSDYTQLFFASAGVGLLFVALIIGAFRHFYDPVYVRVSVPDLIKRAIKNKNICTVTTAHFLLQLFFSWIIIYVPLYLTLVVGFSWQEVSLIISAGLLAYVIFEYPIGIIADRYIGEQEMMAVGFVILAITTASFAFMASASIVWWMGLMFINRIGASLVEVTTESYFFKQVAGEDASLMSLFRLLRPAANVAGALMGSILLAFLPFPIFFLIGAAVLAIGVYLPRFLVDSK